jgi:hypothetical protein
MISHGPVPCNWITVSRFKICEAPRCEFAHLFRVEAITHAYLEGLCYAETDCGRQAT